MQLPIPLQTYTQRRANLLEYSESVRRGIVRIFILQCRRYPSGSIVRLVNEGVLARVLAVNPRFPVMLLVIPIEGPSRDRLRRVLWRNVVPAKALEVTQ